MNRITRNTRSLLPLALLLAIAAPGHVLAQTASPQDLEARIAQLEQLVQGLRTELEAQKAAARRGRRRAPLPAGTQPIQATHDHARRQSRHALQLRRLHQARRHGDRHQRRRDRRRQRRPPVLPAQRHAGGRRRRKATRPGRARAVLALLVRRRQRHRRPQARRATSRSTCSAAAHWQRAVHQHLRPDRPPRLRELGQVAGRPDLVELPGRRRAARRRGLRRPDRRHHLRAPGAAALHQRRRGRCRWRTRKPRCRRYLRRRPHQQRRQHRARRHRALPHKAAWGHFSVAGLVRQLQVRDRRLPGRQRHRASASACRASGTSAPTTTSATCTRTARASAATSASAWAATRCRRPTARSRRLDGSGRLRRLAPCVQPEAARQPVRVSRASYRQRPADQRAGRDQVGAIASTPT